MPLDTCEPCECPQGYMGSNTALLQGIFKTLCNIDTTITSESIAIQGYILCDDNGGVNTPFMRLQVVVPALTVVIVDTELDGLTPYLPTGTVGLCPQELCAQPTGVEACYPDPTFVPFERTDILRESSLFIPVIAPTEATKVDVKLWGAGGGSGAGGAVGGGGAFVSGTLKAQNLFPLLGGGGQAGSIGGAGDGGLNGGSSGGSGGSLGNGGGGGGIVKIGVTPFNNSVIVAGSGGGAGGVGVIAVGGAAAAGTGGDGVPNPLGVGGQGGQPDQNGIGGNPGNPASAGGTGGANFIGSMGGDGGPNTGGDGGDGGGGGAGYTSGGGGNGGSPDPFNSAGGGAGTSFADPDAVENIVYFDAVGATPANIGDPDYEAGVGVGGAPGSDGGQGLIVLRWYDDQAPQLRAVQYLICTNGVTTYEWRDALTGAVVADNLIEECSKSICFTESQSVSGTFQLDVDNPGDTIDFVLNNLVTTDVSSVLQLPTIATDVQTNGWGPPPAGPVPEYPGDFGTIFGSLPWNPNGVNESYYYNMSLIWGTDTQYTCDIQVYVPQFEAVSETDYSGFRWRVGDGPWFIFTSAGSTRGPQSFSCVEEATCEPADLVRVCNLEPQFQVVPLCDEFPAGTFTPFLRKITFNKNAFFALPEDLQLDGVSPYEVQGNVRICGVTPGDSLDVNVLTDPPLTAPTDSVAAEQTTGRVFDGIAERTVQFHTQVVAAAGDTQLLPLAGGLRIRVLGLHVHSLEDVSVFLRSGAAGSAMTGTNPIRARGGYVLPVSSLGWCQTAASTALFTNQSAAVSVAYTIVYIQT